MNARRLVAAGPTAWARVTYRGPASIGAAASPGEAADAAQQLGVDVGRRIGDDARLLAALVRARQSGEWNATRVVHRFRTYVPRFDASSIRSALEEIDGWKQGWEGHFTAGGIEPFRFRYDDLVDDVDVDGTWLQRLVAWLDLGTPPSVAPPTQPQRNDVSDDWIDRFRSPAGCRV